jgi:ribosomal protein L35
MLEGKEPKRRARLRKARMIDKVDEPRLRVLVPYL